MYNSRYSKFLTIILIVVIVIIIGLLIFWGVDTLVKYKTNSDAESGIDAFKNQIHSNNSGNTTLNLPTGGNSLSNTTGGGLVNPYDNSLISSENIISNNNGNTSNSGGEDNETLYKGFPMVGYIEIPKTDLELPVLKEATMNAMETSVCILTGSGLNQPGVTVISGHNYRNGLFFSNNAKLAVGDKIYITDNSGNRVTYSIYKKYQTTPEDASFSTVDTGGKREIVLTTCTDDSQNRIIICAREV